MTTTGSNTMIKIIHNKNSFSCEFTIEMSKRLKNHLFIIINQDGEVISKYKGGVKL